MSFSFCIHWWFRYSVVPNTKDNCFNEGQTTVCGKPLQFLYSFYIRYVEYNNVPNRRCRPQTEGVGLKHVTSQKGTWWRRGRSIKGKFGGSIVRCVHCREAVGKLQWLKINKISLIQIVEDDPSLIRGFQKLNRSYFTLKIVLPFLSDPSVTYTRLHDVVNFHSHACDLNTWQSVYLRHTHTHTGIKRQHSLCFCLNVIKQGGKVMWLQKCSSQKTGGKWKWGERNVHLFYSTDCTRRLCYFNPLKPIGNFTYHQFSHSEIIGGSHIAFMCCVRISEQTATFALHSIKRLILNDRGRRCLLRGKDSVLISNRAVSSLEVTFVTTANHLHS